MHYKGMSGYTSSRFAACPVTEIKPVDGWSLLSIREDDGDGFATIGFIARSTDEDFKLNVSRFFFTPTQERFAFLVRYRDVDPPFGTWTGEQIDAAICDRAREAA